MMNGTKSLSNFQHDQSQDMFAPVDRSLYSKELESNNFTRDSPVRSSFANYCLVSVVSKMG